jgi:surface polysaccharide O-acyltransferase-like enzyme
MARSSVRASLDRIATATPPGRNRVVDLVRAFAVVVVVVWHWVFSVTHRTPDGELVMPNPIGHVPLGWLATWLLQVMPLFFVVGGYANLAGWDAVRRAGGGARAFLRRRAGRLLRPTAVFGAVWVGLEAALHLLLPGYRGILATGMVVFVPLWFLAAYLWVVLLVPVTARMHRRFGAAATAALAVAVALVDFGRFHLGVAGAGLVNTALVWVYAHQLGYLWRDGGLASRSRQAALALGGLAGLVAVTALHAYPRSMVAVPGQALSNMYPTTAGVAALATFQTGVVLLLSGRLARWLRRRRPWGAVAALNSMILTVYLWHMTALSAVVAAVEALGGALPAEPTPTWWWRRPLWLIGPALVLAPLVAAFARVERRRSPGPLTRNVSRKLTGAATCVPRGGAYLHRL